MQYDSIDVFAAQFFNDMRCSAQVDFVNLSLGPAYMSSFIYLDLKRDFLNKHW